MRYDILCIFGFILLLCAAICQKIWNARKLTLEKRWKKEKMVIYRLWMKHPNWGKTPRNQSDDIEYVHNFLKNYAPDGIKLIKDNNVGTEEFSIWTDNNVKVAVHPYGLFTLSKWYANNKESA